jgi:hypothetical protein
MPKKTKQQKIRTDQRKSQYVKTNDSTKIAQIVKTPNNFEAERKSGFSFSLQNSLKGDVSEPKNEINLHDHSHLKTDLIRITIFIILASTSFGVIYFLLNRI